jgi:hypothetical protein
VKSGITRFQPRSISDVYRWFAELYVAGLLYHPDDPAETIMDGSTPGERLFSDEEAAFLNRTMDRMFERFGDRVHDVAYEYFMHAMHGVWGYSSE